MDSGQKIITRRTVVGAGTAAAIAGTAFALHNSSTSIHSHAGDLHTLYRGNGAEPDSLDPHKGEDGNWENNIVGDMFLGLMTEDRAANPIFGASDRYHASADGLTYTFNIRDHKWSDGVPVTASDFVYSLRRILNPHTASQYASILYPIRNAQAVNSGKAKPEQLGVRALDRRTLEISFEFQVPYIEQLLTHMSTFPVPQHAVDRYGDEWTHAKNIVTNGPYTLKEWIPNDHVALRKNVNFYAASTVKVDNVVFYPTQDFAAALKRFRAGEFDVSNAIPSQEIDWLRTNLPSVLHVQPYILTQFVLFNVTRPPFDDLRVREALSLAIDREIIAARVMRAGEKAAYALVPPKMPRYSGSARLRFHSMSMAARIAKAKSLLAAAGFTAQHPLRFDYNFQSHNDARLVAVALQAMWQQIGATARLIPSESQVHYNLLRKQDFSVAWSGWFADYRDAKNYLLIWQTSGKDMNFGRYSNARFDALVEKSDHERDPAQRGRLLVEAEQILLDEVPFAPVYFGVSRDLVSPQVKGWVDNDVNINRSRYLWLDRSRPTA